VDVFFCVFKVSKKDGQNGNNYVASVIDIYYGTYNNSADYGGAYNDGCAVITAYNTANSVDYTDIGGQVTTYANNTTPVYYTP